MIAISNGMKQIFVSLLESNDTSVMSIVQKQNFVQAFESEHVELYKYNGRGECNLCIFMYFFS